MYLASRATRKEATFGDTIGYDSTFYFSQSSNRFAGRWRRSWHTHRAMLWATALGASSTLDSSAAHKIVCDTQKQQEKPVASKPADHLPGSWIVASCLSDSAPKRRDAATARYNAHCAGVLLAPVRYIPSPIDRVLRTCRCSQRRCSIAQQGTELASPCCQSPPRWCDAYIDAWR